MRKLVFFLLLLAPGLITINAQTALPCAEYDQNRDISGMGEILMRDGIFYNNLRAAYAEAINYGMGKNVVTASKDGMEFVLKNTVLMDVNFVVPSDYLNGVRFGDNVTFTSLTGQPSDKWAVFKYEGKECVYAKVSCMNPQRVKKIKLVIQEKPEPTLPLLTSTQPKEELGFSSPRVITEQKVKENVVPDLYLTHAVTKTKTWWGRNWYWVAPVGAAVIGGASYLAYKQWVNHHHYGQPGGASTTRYRQRQIPVINKPPVVIPVEPIPGGPGGAPTTPGY